MCALIAITSDMPKSTEQLRVIQANVSVFLMEEDGQWIACCPALEVSSYGDTEDEAKAAFEDALEIFLDETYTRGTLERELIRMGWTLASSDYYPPAISAKVIHGFGNGRKENRTIQIPAGPANPQSGLFV
jgi:predicted RNase H-like HicB family nuclease